jgi:hypothetical protein
MSLGIKNLTYITSHASILTVPIPLRAGGKEMNLVVTFIDMYLVTLIAVVFGGWAFGGYAEPLLNPKKYPSFLKFFLYIWLPACALMSLIIPVLFVLLLGIRWSNIEQSFSYALIKLFV